MATINGQENAIGSKPRVLCLHGKYQSGKTFATKIGGARRKLERSYDLVFLDAPLVLNGDSENGSTSNRDTANVKEEPLAFGWWHTYMDGTKKEHSLVRECFNYVVEHIDSQDRPYDAMIGFSQGGVVATALACSGLVPSVRAVITAGAPIVEDVFSIADQIGSQNTEQAQKGYGIPKLHLSGETDTMATVDSVKKLCERGGNGNLIIHDQGHLFPTRAARVQEYLEFLDKNVHNAIRHSA